VCGCLEIEKYLQTFGNNYKLFSVILLCDMCPGWSPSTCLKTLRKKMCVFSSQFSCCSAEKPSHKIHACMIWFASSSIQFACSWQLWKCSVLF